MGLYKKRTFLKLACCDIEVAGSGGTGSLRDSESDKASRLLIDSNSFERPAMK